MVWLLPSRPKLHQDPQSSTLLVKEERLHMKETGGQMIRMTCSERKSPISLKREISPGYLCKLGPTQARIAERQLPNVETFNKARLAAARI